MNRPTEKDAIKEKATEYLNLLDQGEPFGTELFNAIARVTVTVAVELIPWRLNPESHTVEILLIKRQPDESDASLFHTPGTVMLCGEKVESDTIPRLVRKELGEECVLSSLRFVDNLNNPNEARGHFFNPVYIARLDGEPEQGEWWSVDSLPPIGETVTVQFHQLWPVAIEAIKREIN